MKIRNKKNVVLKLRRDTVTGKFVPVVAAKKAPNTTTISKVIISRSSASGQFVSKGKVVAKRELGVSDTVPAPPRPPKKK